VPDKRKNKGKTKGRGKRGADRPSAETAEQVERLVEQSMSLWEEGELEGALEAAERACELDPAASSAHHCRAAALLELDRVEEAIEACDAGLDAAPDDPEALLYGADFYLGAAPGDLDAIELSLEISHRGLKLARKSGRVKRGRHHDHAHLRAEGLLRIPQQGQGQVRLQRALMKFIKNNQADAGQSGVALQHARQHTIGNNFNPGMLPRAAVKTRAIPDHAAQALTRHVRHAPGSCTGRKPARLEHKNLTALKPALLRKHKGHNRGFPGPGRSLHDKACFALKDGAYIVKDRCDGKCCRAGHRILQPTAVMQARYRF